MKSALCILTSLLFITSVRVANGATVPTICSTDGVKKVVTRNSSKARNIAKF